MALQATVSLGSTDLAVSRVCLGTGAYGTGVPEERAFRLLDLFVESGGNFLDTAHVYACWLPDGEGASERTIGRWLRRTGMRDRVVIGTKGGHPPLDAMEVGRCGPAALEQDLCESLERLQLDSVDLYWLHRDDEARTVAEIVDTLAGFVDSGRVRAYGFSNWSTERMQAALEYADSRGLARAAASQPGWAAAPYAQGSVAWGGMRYMDDQTYAWHRAQRFPAVAYSSQAGGFFGAENVAWARSGFRGAPPRGAAYDSPVSRGLLERATALAQEHECTTNQVALASLLNHSFPTVAIVGNSSEEHLREALAAPALRLTADELQWLATGSGQAPVGPGM
jgi:aryl-alcohol dehydrogenase-like predicted oxidoreductase